MDILIGSNGSFEQSSTKTEILQASFCFPYRLRLWYDNKDDNDNDSSNDNQNYDNTTTTTTNSSLLLLLYVY